jgi:hypothetical protein
MISSYQNRSEAVDRWSLFFLLIGTSTFFGSIAHSISCNTNSFTYQMVWVVMQLTSGMSVFYAQRSVISAQISNSKQKRNLERFTLFQFIVFVSCVILFMDFKVVAINSAIGLFQLLYLTFPQKVNVWNYNSMVSSGFIISFASIYVNRNQLSFASWFNYNDVAHLIMLLSLYLIYRGVKDKHHNVQLQESMSDAPNEYESSQEVFEEIK